MFEEWEASQCLALHNSKLSGRGSHNNLKKLCSIVLQHQLTWLASPLVFIGNIFTSV